MKVYKSLLSSVLSVVLCGVVSARTMSVTDVGENTVKLALGDSDGRTYSICVGYGATDGGDDKYAWASFSNLVTTVAADATTVTVTMPDDLVANRGTYKYRIFMLQTEDLPYAQELTYIESTGTQYIDTGVKGRSGTKVEADLVSMATEDRTILGCRNGGTRFFLIHINTYGYWSTGYGDFRAGSVSRTANKVHVVSELNAGCQKLTVDGKSSRDDATAGAIDTKLNMYLCAANYSSNKQQSKVKVYNMKIWQDDTLVRSFYPVKFSDGTGGVCNGLTGDVYANIGTGVFTLGDVREDEANRRGIVRASSPTMTLSLTEPFQIVELTESSVTVRLSCKGARSFYLASGTTDGGDDKFAWDSFDKLGDVAMDQAEATFALPAGKRSGRCSRFFLLRTSDLPYTRELAYIQSGNGQYIDTGVTGKTNSKMEADVAHVSGSDCTLLGSRKGGDRFFLAHVYYYNWRVWNGNWDEDGTIAYKSNTKVHLSSEISSSKRYLAVDGVQSLNKGSSAKDTGYSMYLFAANIDGVVKQNIGARVYSLDLTQDGQLVRRFVPVYANGDGALYDVVTGKVFPNKSTNKFTLGEHPVGDEEKVNRRGIVKAMSVSFPAGTLIAYDRDNDKQTVTVPEGVTLDTLSFAVVASSLEKQGAGTLVLKTNLSDLTSALAVKGGTLKLGAEWLLTAKNTITVEAGGAFDVAGFGENSCHVVVAGTGPDGNGALCNTGGNIGNGTQQLSSLTLTGDALVRSSSNFGLLAPSYASAPFELNGHTLTIDYAAGKNFWFVNAQGETAGTILVKSGIAHFRKNPSSLPRVDVVIDGSNAKFEVPGSTSANVTLNALTIQNGGWFYEGDNKCYLQDLTLLDNARVDGNVKWIYVAKNVVVSNETSDLSIYPPICNNGTYPKLWKYGAGTLTLANNHTENRIDGGVEIFGGMVVMDSSHASSNCHAAVSSQAVPVTVHAGGTLDMRKCAQPVKITTLALELNGSGEGGRPLGGIWTDTTKNTIAISSNATFDVTALYAAETKPETVTLLEAKAITGVTRKNVTATGGPVGSAIIVKADRLTLGTGMPVGGFLSTLPWQQNVYTNRFTIMCEAQSPVDGLELQYGDDYDQTAEMTCEETVGNTYVYKARVTVAGREGAEIPYRMAVSGLAMTGEGATGVVKLWKSDANDFTCAIWGDNQSGARQYDWDADRFQYIGAIFRHMIARDVDFGICTGDMASSASYSSQIKPCNLETTDAIFGRFKPYYVAWGNHDTSYPKNKPFFETPAIDDPTYQSSTSGNAYLYRGNTLLIFLDDGLHSQDATKTWLADLLATPRAQAAAFRLVYHHQPIYTEVSGSQCSTLRQTFIDGKVDVVFGGHMHGYERIHKDGVIYVINGCMGYLDHDITVKHNYGDDSKVGGHLDLPYLWARQKSAAEKDELGPSEPAQKGMVMGYGELTIKNGALIYRQHAFNADGSYIGVCDSFRLGNDVEDSVATACADPSTFAAFTGKPVTNVKWKEYADAVGLSFAYAEGKGDDPVVNVSKTDIARFLAWLNGTTGTYRLPTVTELQSAFGGQLRRAVSEWTSSVDSTTGRCLILGSPAKARAGVWERAADRPSMLTADCHADYVGFRLATGAAPSEPSDPFAAPLAALAQIENPAAVYKWENNTLVDISSEWNAETPTARTYAVPVIFTGTGDLSFVNPNAIVLAGGFAAPKASSLTVSGPLTVGTRLAFGSLAGSTSAELTGFVLSGATLTLDGVTSVGSCVQFRSGDGVLRLKGENDFTSAALNFGAASVTSLVSVASGTATTLRARSARQYKRDTAYQFALSADVSLVLTDDFKCEKANYRIDGLVDVAGITMTSANGPSFFGSGTLRTGEFAMYGDSDVTWGVSNIVLTSVRPFRTNNYSGTKDLFVVAGAGVRLRSTQDWTVPTRNNANRPIQISSTNVWTSVPRLIFDTRDPDGAASHTVTLPTTALASTDLGLGKDGTGKLVLQGSTFPLAGETRVSGGELALPAELNHAASISVGANGKLSLPGALTTSNVTFDGGTLALGADVVFSGAINGARKISQPAEGKMTVALGTAQNGAITLADGTERLAVQVTGVKDMGQHLVLGESGLAASQIDLTSDSTQSATTIVDARGNAYLCIFPKNKGKIALWTGLGRAGDPTDAANWACFDGSGVAIEGALPDSDTTVFFTGTCTASFATASFTVKKILCTDVFLAADCDWRAFGTTPFEGNLDLNGHKLQLAALTGTGAITSRPLAVEGYEPLVYAQSDGSSYVDTGVIGKTGISTDADAMALVSDWDGSLTGARKGNVRFIPIWDVNQAIGFGYNTFRGGKNYGGFPYDTFYANQRYVFSNRMGDGHQDSYVNGVRKCWNTQAGTYDTGYSMYVFACNTDGAAKYCLKSRIYALRFFTDNGATAAGDFVPARRTSDGKIGLYDKVAQVFREGQGADLKAGATVTATPGTAGELWIEVPEGTTVTNGGVLIAGGAKLVKSGKGVYKTTVAMQTYTGGTCIVQGGFDLGLTPSNQATPLGVANPKVMVSPMYPFWGTKRAFGWQTKPTDVTVTLDPNAPVKSYTLREHTDGWYVYSGLTLFVF